MVAICEKERVEVAMESLGLIAREAGGSIRDGLSLLDQVMSCTEGAITHKQVLDILGIIDGKILFDISKAVINKDISEVLDILDEVYRAGHDMKKLFSDLVEHFRNLLVVKMGKKISKLVDTPLHEIDLMFDQVKEVSGTFLNQIFDLLFQEEVTVLHATQPKLAIEMIFIRIFQIKPALAIDVLIEKLDSLKKEIDETPADSHETPKMPVRQTDEKQKQGTSDTPVGIAESQAPFTSEPPDVNEKIDRTWKRLLALFSEKHPALAANLKHAAIKKLADQRLEIEINGNDFNINMVRREKNTNIIKTVCNDFFGKEMDVIITTKKIQNNESHQIKNSTGRLKQEALSHPLVADTLEIFNGNAVDVKIL